MCLRYLICACISLKNKSRSTFNDRFIAVAMWRRWRFIALFVCFPRHFYRFLRLCALHRTSVVQRSSSCTREFCNARRAQSAVIYFAIAINKSRCSARSRDLIALPILSPCLFQVTSRLTTSVIGRSCHDHLLSLSDFFYSPSLSSVLTVNISYMLANIERYFLSRYFLALHAIGEKMLGKTCECMSKIRLSWAFNYSNQMHTCME